MVHNIPCYNNSYSEFSEHHENILKEENIKKYGNLDYEDGIVDNILTKIAKKFRETIHSEENREKVSR